jgi:hypothetical protein
MSSQARLRFNARVVFDHGGGSCPNCGQVLPSHVEREAWVEVPIADGWVAAYRVQVRDRLPVITEVRVIPDQHRDSGMHGDWGHDVDSVPVEGLPGSALRLLRVSDAIGLFEELEESWEQAFGAEMTERIFRRHGLRSAEPVGRRPGRAGRPDAFYARWAEAYVDRLAKGSRSPIKDLAADPPFQMEGFASSTDQQARATIRAILQEARRRGLLTRPPRGRAGGRLTPKGIEVLDLPDGAG